MAKMKKDLAQAMRHIYEINSVCKDEEKDDDETPAYDAGDSFGGRNSKRQKSGKWLFGDSCFCWVITVVWLLFNSILCYPKQAPTKWPHLRICVLTTSVRRPNGTNRTVSKVKYVMEDKDKVIAERARTGTARPGKRTKGRKVSAANTQKQKR